MIVIEPEKEREREIQEHSFFELPDTEQEVRESKPVRRTREQILEEMFRQSPRKPRYDASRPQELRRLARASAISKGINTLGGIYSLSKGAIVRPKQDDQKEAHYLDHLFGYQDDYQKRLENWDYQDFANRMKMGEVALRDADRRDDMNFRARQLQSQEHQKAEQLQAQRDIAEQKDILGRVKLGVDAAHKESLAKSRERIADAAMVRAINTGKAKDAIKEPKSIQLSDGTVIPITPEQYSRFRHQAILKTNELQKLYPEMFEPVFRKNAANIDVFTGEYQPKKTVKDDDLVRAYLNYAHRTEQQAKQTGTGILDKYMRPEETFPYRSTEIDPKEIARLVQQRDVRKLYNYLKDRNFSDEVIKQYFDEVF